MYLMDRAGEIRPVDWFNSCYTPSGSGYGVVNGEGGFAFTVVEMEDAEATQYNQELDEAGWLAFGGKPDHRLEYAPACYTRSAELRGAVADRWIAKMGARVPEGPMERS